METTAPNAAEIHLFLVAFSAALAAFALFVANYFGYFSQQSKPSTLPWQEAGKIFLIFILFQFLIFPLLASFWLLLRGETGPITYYEQGWWNVVLVALMTLVMAVWGLYKSQFVKPLFTSLHLLKDISLGCISWFIAYPLVLLFSQLIMLILSQLFELPLVDQVAVRQIKQVTENPTLLYATMFTVICVVPVLEELLFRGFLQGALRNYLSPVRAILITSAIFAFFHFSFHQGVNNLTILGSLFLLSLFLGFLKERQGNLWAPIVMHMTFNAISISMILSEVGDNLGYLY